MCCVWVGVGVCKGGGLSPWIKYMRMLVLENVCGKCCKHMKHLVHKIQNTTYKIQGLVGVKYSCRRLGAGKRRNGSPVGADCRDLN